MLRSGAVVFALAVALVACARYGAAPPAPEAALPKPVLPAWIVSVSPVGDADPLAQIRVIFSGPVVPLSALTSKAHQDIADRIRLEPALPGRFIVLTPRMVAFVPERALPVATRVRVTLAAGLADLAGHRLDRDLAWTFATPALDLEGLPTTPAPSESPSPMDVRPSFHLSSNAELDVASLQQRATFRANGDIVAAAVKPATTPTPGAGDANATFDASQLPWTYELKPVHDLAKARRYELRIAAGVAPAHGNLPTTESASGFFTTYAPLRVRGIERTDVPDETGAEGRFVDGAPEVAFNNPLDAKSALAGIRLDPQPNAAGKLFSVSDGDNAIAINPYLLGPDRQYTVRLSADITDAFGQKLGQPASILLYTSHLAADLWAPSGAFVFPNDRHVTLDAYATNLRGNRLHVAFRRVAPVDLLAFDEPDPSNAGNPLLPPLDRWPAHVLPARPDVQQPYRAPLQAALGAPAGVLAYGLSAETNPYDNSGARAYRVATYSGIVSLSDLGIFTQWFPSSGEIRVQRLSTGEPVPGAQISVYRSQLEQAHATLTQPCAGGATDAQGALVLSMSSLAACYAGDRPDDEAPALFTVARDGADWAYARTLSYSGAYNYGIYSSWSAGAPLSRGTIFSDRSLYQPGEDAWFSGVAYYYQSGRLQAEANAAYRLRLEQPDGTKRPIGTVRTNEFGTFSVHLTVRKNDPLGYWTIVATGASGNELDGTFRVAEFKPPNFSTALSLGTQNAAAGSSVDADVASTYLFGAPLQGASAKFTVTRQTASFVPKGWDGYSFGRQWFWPEQPPDFTTDVLTQTSTLDAKGGATLRVPVAADLPFGMTYTVDADVTDASNLSVADSKTFNAFPDTRLIGLNTDFVGDAGKPFAVKTIVTGPDGKPQSGVRVHLELQSMTYTSATQAEEGGESAVNAIQYATVDRADVTSGNGPQSVNLTPPASGSYRIRANLGDAKSEASATDVQMWASGPQTVSWNSETPDVLKIDLDKAKYRVGDTATVLIQSPYAKADLYLAVVRDRVLWRERLAVQGGAPRVRVPVTAAMLPNAAVQAVLVRRGATPAASGEHLDSLARIGLASFNVDLSQKYLKLKIAPQLSKLQPQGLQRVGLSVTDDAGKPVRAQFVVAVANDAILQLSGYRFPDLVQTVFADEPISTRFADNRSNVVLQPAMPALAKGWGYGGGFMAGAAGTRVRKQFLPLAYYNGSVVADAAGHAAVSFKVPDDLTTWRVLAVAMTAPGDVRFGSGDATFITTKPLVTNALLPQFARPGDTIDAGLSILNATGTQGSVGIDGALGGALTFAPPNSGVHLQASVAAPSGLQAYRYPMLVGTQGSATMRFTSVLNGFTDAFSYPLEIRTQDVTESAIELGATRTTATVPIDLREPGTLQVTLASNVVPQIALPATLAMQDDELPFTSDAVSRLTIASAIAGLRASGTQVKVPFDAGAEARQNVAAIWRAQRSDGGFAAWPGGTSDVFVSAAAYQALAFARDNGVSVDAAPLRKAASYLSDRLADPARESWCTSALEKAQLRLSILTALAAGGDRRAEYLDSIYLQRAALDVASQVRLARYMSAIPWWSDTATQLSNALMQDVALTGRYAAINVPSQWSWYDSTVQAQSELVELMVARHAPADEVDAAVRQLLAQRCTCGWGSLYDSAAALQALAQYAKANGRSGPIEARVQAGARALGTVHLGGSDSQEQTFSLSSAHLPSGPLTIVARGGGLLRYIVLYRYRPSDTAGGTLAGLRVIRDVRAANQSALLTTMDLDPYLNPFTIAAAQVYDVGVRLIADHPIDNVIVEDPLPAGFEAVDTSFVTTSASLQAREDSWQIDYQTIYHDRIVAFAQHLEAGVYDVHYLVRSVTPGSYRWPGSHAFLQYAPEQFGRTASARLNVSP
ncbi:MAG: alpha-2-macroglobulin family protein [Candidatus Eremiobacteraeota bacterium]|nr:alpha-2-macroglobulin family protein [Candidatus Eremiobacteraeota bacterium]